MSEEKITCLVDIGVLKRAVEELERLLDLPPNPLTIDILQARFSLTHLITQLERYRKETKPHQTELMVNWWST
jgi:hypothetical protein